MKPFEHWMESDLQRGVKVRQAPGNLFCQDNEGNLIGVRVTDGGENVALAGTVVGYIIRPDNETVVVEGQLSGNQAWILVPSQALAYTGQISAVIQIVDGSVKTTLAACVGTVMQSRTDAFIDPGDIVPDLSDLLAQVEACRTATANANTATKNANTAKEAAAEAARTATDAAQTAADAAQTAADAAERANEAAEELETHPKADLDANGKVPTSELPDEALLKLGETSATAYRGDRGKAAYTHAVTNKGKAFASGLYKITTNAEGHVTGAAAAEKADIGLGNVDNTSDADKPISTAAQAALDLKADDADVFAGCTIITPGDGNSFIPSARKIYHEAGTGLIGKWIDTEHMVNYSNDASDPFHLPTESNSQWEILNIVPELMNKADAADVATNAANLEAIYKGVQIYTPSTSSSTTFTKDTYYHQVGTGYIGKYVGSGDANFPPNYQIPSTSNSYWEITSITELILALQSGKADKDDASSIHQVTIQNLQNGHLPYTYTADWVTAKYIEIGGCEVDGAVLTWETNDNHEIIISGSIDEGNKINLTLTFARRIDDAFELLGDITDVEVPIYS